MLNREATKLCTFEQFVFKETLEKVIYHWGHWTKSLSLLKRKRLFEKSHCTDSSTLRGKSSRMSENSPLTWTKCPSPEDSRQPSLFRHYRARVASTHKGNTCSFICKIQKGNRIEVKEEGNYLRKGNKRREKRGKLGVDIIKVCYIPSWKCHHETHYF